MRFPAQVQASIDILNTFFETLAPIESVLRDWSKRNRYAGSSDRRKIKDMVYEGLRNRRSLAWIANADGETAQDVMYGYCLKHDHAIADIFTGDTYAPAVIEPREPRTLDGAPEAVRYDMPDWLPEISENDVILLSQNRAPIDLRVNKQKTTQLDVEQALSELDIDAQPIAQCPTGLRVEANTRIQTTDLYQKGLIEIQDASSQMAMADMPEGQTVLDFCAGGGGKSLALAAQGRTVIATDADASRMKDLPARAKRASVKIEICDSKALKGRKFDVVLVDAPCSGSGTWRRNPAEKWRLTPDRLQQLHNTQLDILQQALAHVKQGGYLVYCTCSLFDEENTQIMQKALSHIPNMTCLSERTWTPSRDSCDGFYKAVFEIH